MRAFAFALAASIAVTGPAGAEAPRRVASLKLCTDELLLMLAEPRQIASVTYLSAQPLESPLWRQARRHHRNDGSLLDVAPLAPDLVIDMGGGGRDGGVIAHRLGVRTLLLPYPNTLGDVEKSIRTVAAALGRPAAGAEILSGIAALRRTAPRRKIDSAWLGGGGRSFPARGLGADWMALAGLEQRNLPGDRITLEQMLVQPPALLVRSNYRANQYSAEQGWLSHPLLASRRRTRLIETDGRRWTCMGPLMITETVRLRKRLSA